MNNFFKTCIGGLTMLALSMCFTSCSDDDGPSYSNTVLENTELKSILTQKGYQFNEEGKLLLDDMAKQTTSPDLSGTGISVDALPELSILPNLTDVDLSDNGYTMSFDFTKLPAQITGVDLTGNEIYEYPGLLNIVTQENGDEDVTVLRNLTKLYLPESAKYNCVEIPTYFTTVTGVDMQMANASGTLETYTTLREVPDETARELLQSFYPSLFNGDKIDISRRMVKSDEKTKNLWFNYSTIPSGKSITSVEGAEYIIMNPSFQGSSIDLQSSEECTLPYLKLNSNASQFGLLYVNTPNLDMSPAKNLCYFRVQRNNGLVSVDLSNCVLMGQRTIDYECDFTNNPSTVEIYECDNFESLTFPPAAKIIGQVNLGDLPKLEKLDLSQFDYIGSLCLSLLPNCTITYLDYKRWGIDEGNTMFTISEDIYEKEETKAFLEKYHEDLKEGYLDVGKKYRWSRLYK